MVDNQLDTQIGNRLTELIGLLKTNSRQFAKSIDIDPSQFVKIQKGIRGLSIEKAVEVSSIYNVSVRWLILGEGEVFEKAESSRQERDEEKQVTIVFNSKDLKAVEQSLSTLAEFVRKLQESDIVAIPGAFQNLPLGNNEVGQKKEKKKGKT